MPLNLSQKKDLVKEMTTMLSDAEVVLTADYSGLTSTELNELERQLEKQVYLSSLSRIIC